MSFGSVISSGWSGIKKLVSVTAFVTPIVALATRVFAPDTFCDVTDSAMDRYHKLKGDRENSAPKQFWRPIAKSSISGDAFKLHPSLNVSEISIRFNYEVNLSLKGEKEKWVTEAINIKIPGNYSYGELFNKDGLLTCKGKGLVTAELEKKEKEFFVTFREDNNRLLTFINGLRATCELSANVNSAACITLMNYPGISAASMMEGSDRLAHGCVFRDSPLSGELESYITASFAETLRAYFTDPVATPPIPEYSMTVTQPFTDTSSPRRTIGGSFVSVIQSKVTVQLTRPLGDFKAGDCSSK